MYKNQFTPPSSGFPGYSSYGHNFYPPNYQQYYPPPSVATPPPLSTPSQPSQGDSLTPPLPSQDHTPPVPPLPSDPPPHPPPSSQNGAPSEVGEAPVVTNTNSTTSPVAPTAAEPTPINTTQPEITSNNTSEAQQFVSQPHSSVATAQSTSTSSSQPPVPSWQQPSLASAHWQNAAAMWSGQALPPPPAPAGGGVVAPGYYQQWGGAQWPPVPFWPPPPLPPPPWRTGAEAWTGSGGWPQWQGQPSQPGTTSSVHNQQTQQLNVTQTHIETTSSNTDRTQHGTDSSTIQDSDPMDATQQTSRPYSPSHPTTADPPNKDTTVMSPPPPLPSVGYVPPAVPSVKVSGCQPNRQPLLPTPPISNNKLDVSENHLAGTKRKWAPIGEQQQDFSYNAVPPPGHLAGRRPNIDEDRTPTPPPLTSDELKNQAVEKRDPWPPSLKSYINRAFAACTSPAQSDKVHEFLQNELHTIFEEKRQLEIDWDSYPLPMYMEDGSRKKRSRWDTPSPHQADLVRGSPYQLGISPSQRGGQQQLQQQQQQGRTLQSPSTNEQSTTTPGSGGGGWGRGKRRKKNKGRNKGRKGRYFVDKEPSPMVTEEESARMSQRAQRFNTAGGGGAEGEKTPRKKLSLDDLARSLTTASFEDGEANLIVVGTSQSLEKQYLRLTSAPDPSTVRPEPVLKRSLELVKEKWLANRDYHHTCEQLKAIRQDLTIQGVRNLFTVEVYESHGRVALENGDREEFNQCQTQLMALYREGLPGCQAEFLAYRILYLILTESTAEMPTVLLELTSDLRHSPCVSHALRVHSAWLLGNHFRFFQLYRSAPNMGPALMDMFVARERKAALRAFAKAFRPALSVTRVSALLGFDGDTSSTLEFLSSVGAVLDASGTSLDCKLTTANLQ